jgi:hypothetical protein
MKEKNSTDYIVVFRTGKLVEIDSAVNVLKEAGIPHFMREETSGGLRMAMSATPAMGPGEWFSLLVPERSLRLAKEFLSQLPFEIRTDPGVWGFGPKKGVKSGWKIYLAISLLIGLIVLLLGFLK